MEYSNIVVATEGNTGIITFNRPDTLNALNEEMLVELVTQLELWDNNSNIGAIILWGGEKAFAAGIDIKELCYQVNEDHFNIEDWRHHFERIEAIQKPIIAAVSGYALGIGCELALSCDIILCSDTARFGLPELSLGMLPGFGGLNRLNKAIGKAKTMEAILTGRAITAEEAYNSGLVSRIIALPELANESLRVAAKVAAQPRVAAMLAKDTIKASRDSEGAENMEVANKNCKICLNSEEFKRLLNNFCS